MRNGHEGVPNRPVFRATLSQSSLTFPFLYLQNEPPGRAFWIWCWAVGGGSIWHHHLAQSMGWSISNWQGSGVIKLGILIRGGGGRTLGTLQPLTPALVSLSTIPLTLQAHLSGGGRCLPELNVFLCPCPVYGRHIGVREKQEPLWSCNENRFGSIVL